jgi:hypothetical protein
MIGLRIVRSSNIVGSGPAESIRVPTGGNRPGAGAVGARFDAVRRPGWGVGDGG